MDTVLCKHCGRGPARHIQLDRIVSILVAFKYDKLSGIYCRDCGQSLARSYSYYTWLAGCWGIGAIMVPAFLVHNWSQFRSLQKLPRPSTPHMRDQNRPFVAGGAGIEVPSTPVGMTRVPLPLGRPLLLRPTTYIPPAVLCALVALWWFTVMR